jgi:hypothetical protein
MLSWFTEVVWLAAGLSILGSVIIFFLSPMYEFFQYTKHSVDTETKLYTIMCEALDKSEETGKPISITLMHSAKEGGEDED